MGAGLPKIPGEFHKIPEAKVAIIGARWHSDCIEAMIDRAHKELLAIDVKPENITVHRVPGSLEIPFAARVLFEADPELDTVIAFGVVLEGITSHDESVLFTVVNGLSEITRQFGKPIINEVIGVKSIEDAHKRSGDNNQNKGVEAVYAASELLHWWRGVAPKKSSSPPGAGRT
ncbi:6,7-dimethyl-8-ribityllumazine synthase [Candidatus Sororendozoicomonas aggregata]|uniref:6,7-dimethyl-8-ribityllumazine synthase n=1 Tax=Candidatus Sororendozoicomonas aggregata TaxID=3073239 RepID=UPI002ED0DAE4